MKKYFITKKNNYYKKFAQYEGFGIIDNDFYFDVHSINRKRYLSSLKNRAKQINKDIYCLFDTSIIIYNRKTKELDAYGKVVIFNKKRRFINMYWKFIYNETYPIYTPYTQLLKILRTR